MSNVLIDREKIDILANAISDKSGVPVTMTLDEMVEAVDGIESNPAPTLQAKTYNVSSAGTATVTADSGYDGLSSVAVSVPQGQIEVGLNSTYYTENNQRKWRIRAWGGVESGDSCGSEGWISDHTIENSDYNVRPAIASGTIVTPTTSSQTIGGTNYMMEGAVTVSAIPSGTHNLYIYDNGFYNNSSNQYRWRITPCDDIENGFLESGYYSGTPLDFNAIPSNTTITPTESSQTIGGADYHMEGAVTVNAIPSNYVGSGITQRSSSDLTVSGATVTVPSGYYSAQASKVVTSGTAGTPTATKGTVSNHQVSVTPSVTNTEGYITGGTKTGTAVTVSASELVSGSQTITDNGTTDVTNLASVTVAIPFVTYYTGSSAPASSLGSDGDIYLKTV